MTWIVCLRACLHPSPKTGTGSYESLWILTLAGIILWLLATQWDGHLWGKNWAGTTRLFDREEMESKRLKVKGLCRQGVVGYAPC